MNLITSKIAAPLMAAGIVPTLSLVAPSFAYAKTVDDLPLSVQDEIAIQKDVVINDAIKLEEDTSMLATAEYDQARLRDDLSRTYVEDSLYRDQYDDDSVSTSFYTDNIENNPEYDAAMKNTADLSHQVAGDTEQLSYDANRYRALLFNNGLPVPDVLPFISENA